MGRSVGHAANPDIDTPSKRSRLLPRKNPYWAGISGGRGGVSLGCRRNAHGPGSWVAKAVLDGSRLESKLGLADDDGAPHGALTYRRAVSEALEWGRQQQTAIENRDPTSPRSGPTVATAAEAYALGRKSRSQLYDGRVESSFARYVLSDAEFARTPLAKMRSSTIESWRSRLASGDGKDLAPATVNRLLNDLRAALNAAAERHRRELPASLAAEIKVGTRAVPVADEARKQLLTDEQVRKVVEAAFEIDDEGDFGRLVLLAATTGARYSQLARVRVCDVQPRNERVMVPGARKGRSGTDRPPVAVLLPSSAVDRLSTAVNGRAAEEPLLTRWAYRKLAPFKWEKAERRAWGPSYEVDKPWAATIALAELPGETIMYALRHSSIVRGLRAGLPVRLVAQLHDTSSEMIEKHYSAFIIDLTEDLARRAALNL